MKRLSLIFLFLINFAIGHGQSAATAVSAHFGLLTDSASAPLHNFSVTEKDKKALLRWKSDSLPAPESFYAVERSNNGTDFTLVGITKSVNSGWIEFIDDSPPKGKIFYRVKLSSGQTSWYSAIISVVILSDALCKFYPNPVDKVLIVKSELSIELLISDRSGKPLIAEKFPGGLKVIDVSSLEPGIYVITLFQKETGRQFTEKLVKK